MKNKLLTLLCLLALTGYVVAGEIDQLSTTDASNVTRFPENMAPSRVNNAARELEGLLARWNADTNGSLIAYGNSGAPNAISVTPNRAVNSLYDGFTLAFTATFANTGAATLRVATQSAIAVKKSHDQDLASGDIESGMRVVVAYSASEAVFHMLNQHAGSTSVDLDSVTDVDLTGKAVSEVLAFAGGSGNWLSRSISELGGRTQGRNTIWVPAGAMISRSSTGAAPGTSESSTNKVMTKTLDYDRDTIEYGQFLVAAPTDWNQGALRSIFYWTSTNATGAVEWLMQGLALRDGDTIDTAYGTAVGVTDTSTAANAVLVSTETSDVTLGGTVGAGALWSIQIYRNATGAGDTSLVDAKLVGVKLIYTTNAANDN